MSTRPEKTLDERELERRAKEQFERSVGALDAATRSKLTQARHRALRELDSVRPSWQWSWAPAGVLATAAVAAWLMLGPGSGPAPVESTVQPASLADLDILLGEDELEMLDEDLDFYAWLEGQPGFEAPAPTDDGVG